jgi:methylmalonyl-CoA mutase cobalamin-binding domain/chain
MTNRSPSRPTEAVGETGPHGVGRIRVLVTVLGLDQHEAGALAVARLLRDAGAEVVYTGRFNDPETIAAIATEEDVDVVGISCHSWEFLHYAEGLATRLHAEDPPIPVVIGGSIITPADRDEVLAKGIDAAVLPTAPSAEVIETVRALAARRRQG